MAKIFISTKWRDSASRIVYLLPAIAFLVGIYALATGLSEYIVTRTGPRWKETEGVITQSSIHQNTFRKGNTDEIHVAYRYTVEDITYTNTAISHHPAGTEREHISPKTLAAFRKNRTVLVHYNTRCPDRAVLITGPTEKTTKAIFVGGLFLVLSIFFFFMMRYSYLPADTPTYKQHFTSYSTGGHWLVTITPGGVKIQSSTRPAIRSFIMMGLIWISMMIPLSICLLHANPLPPIPVLFFGAIGAILIPFFFVYAFQYRPAKKAGDAIYLQVDFSSKRVSLPLHNIQLEQGKDNFFIALEKIRSETKNQNWHVELNLVIPQDETHRAWPIVHYLGHNPQIQKLMKRLAWHGFDCRERKYRSSAAADSSAIPPFITSG